MTQTTAPAIMRKAAYLGELARDHGRIGNISLAEVTDLTGRIAGTVADWREHGDADLAAHELDRIAGEISDI